MVDVIKEIESIKKKVNECKLEEKKLEGQIEEKERKRDELWREISGLGFNSVEEVGEYLTREKENLDSLKLEVEDLLEVLKGKREISDVRVSKNSSKEVEEIEESKNNGNMFSMVDLI